MSTDVFCPLPWVSQATRNDGVFRVCAHTQNSPCRGEARNQSGPAFTADQSLWDEAYNAGSLKVVRAAFLKNQWPEACQRCRLENQSGIASRQAEEMKRYQNSFNILDAQKVTLDDGTLKVVRPLALDLRFGNRCNLKCVMCSPKASDLWYEDHERVWGPLFKNWREENVDLTTDGDKVKPSESMNEWYNSDHFMEQLIRRLPTVRMVHFSGGEPVVTKRFYEVLEVMVELGTAAESTIEFITNGTLIPPKLQSYFDRFKVVKIGVSVDSVGEKNEYIRFPTRWEKVLETLALLDKTSPNVHTWIAVTMMVYNILDLPEIIEWRDQMNFLKLNNNATRTLFSDHPLHNPSYLSMQILPLEIKQVIARKLLAYVEQKKHFASLHLERNRQLALGNLRSMVESNIQFMMSEDRSHLLPKFLKYTERLDRVRGNCFESTFPELAKLLEPYRERQASHEHSSLHL